MQFPLGFHIGSTFFTAHGVLEFLAIFIAFRYYLFLKKKEGDHIPRDRRLGIVISATFGAVAGSHLVGAMEDIPRWMAAESPWIYLWANKTLVGGLLGGLAGVETFKLVIKERKNSGDLFVFPLLLGMIIGRIGCFSAGVYEETYGFPSSLPWAMNLGDGIPRHPASLYEIVFLILLWRALAMARKKWPLQQGALFKLFLVSYLIFRLLLDFIKPGWRYFLGMGTIQLFCLAGLLYYLKYLITPTLLLKRKT